MATGAPSSSLPRSPTPRSSRRDRRRARRSGAVGPDLIDAVVDYLAPSSLLLVIDNCEHLLGRRHGCRPLAAVRSRADDHRDEPRAAARAGRGHVPRSVTRHPRSRSGLPSDAEYERAAVRRACVPPGLRLDEERADIARICFGSTACRSRSSWRGPVGALGRRSRTARRSFRICAAAACGDAPADADRALQWSHDLLAPSGPAAASACSPALRARAGERARARSTRSRPRTSSHGLSRSRL